MGLCDTVIPHLDPWSAPPWALASCLICAKLCATNPFTPGESLLPRPMGNSLFFGRAIRGFWMYLKKHIIGRLGRGKTIKPPKSYKAWDGTLTLWRSQKSNGMFHTNWSFLPCTTYPSFSTCWRCSALLSRVTQNQAMNGID
jgi:hypothetical protein